MSTTAANATDQSDVIQKSKWEKQPRHPLASMFGITSPNELLRGDGFFISYNPGTDQGKETALCKDDNSFILLGDYRDAYEQLVPKGYVACLQYFKESNAERSMWSDTP